MLRNYIITALRNLKRNKVYTSLNVIGLALGIGCAVVIFKVIRYEMSFDKHQSNYEKIYRVVNENIYPDRTEKGQGVPHPMGRALINDYPELEVVTQVHYDYGTQINVRNEDGSIDKFIFDEGIAHIDSNYFEVFDVNWIAGDEEGALKDPGTVVITRSVARKLFALPEGEESKAMGKTIDYNRLVDHIVVGVIEDPVETTNFPFTMLFSYSGLEKTDPYYNGGKNWHSTSSSTNAYFVPSSDNFDPIGFDQKLLDLVEKYRGEGESEETHYLTQPLSNIHFNEDFDNYTGSTSIKFLYALGVIGLFLVLTACINFVNLATAQAANRSKEIGIRKAIGSLSSQLVVQFLSEIAIITLIALLLSLAISEILFISLEDLMGYRLTLNLLDDYSVPGFLSILFVVVTLLSGFYPSVLLSRMNTVMALKSKITSKNHSGGLSLRKGLVIIQFTITQFLIIGTLVITAQMKYFGAKDLGFETEAILTTYLPQRDDETKNERFRQLMLNSSAISEVTFSISQPTGNSNSSSNFNYAPLESENSYHGNFKPVDEFYMDLFGIELLAGRKIRKGDTSRVVINRKIADLMGFEGRYEDAINEELETGWGDKKIVGVMENFHVWSLRHKMDFALLLYEPRVFYSVSFKTSSEHGIEAAIDHYEKVWEQVFPEYVSDYEFYDEQIAERYEYEQNVSGLMRIFSIISILIGCLGLYGLISFIALNKTKEIGVRKVLGASITNILGMFSKEIILLMSIAFLVATPLAWYLMINWLEQYAFRIEIGPWFFVIAFIITLTIAFITISHRTITSAMINPAKTLKDE